MFARRVNVIEVLCIESSIFETLINFTNYLLFYYLPLKLSLNADKSLILILYFYIQMPLLYERMLNCLIIIAE